MSAIHKRQRWMRLFAFALASFGLLEIGWRTYLFNVAPLRRVAKFARLSDMPAAAYRYRPHPYLIYALNEEYTSDDGLTRHNSHGCRGPEFATHKAPGTYRIVCLGGSTTYDSAVSDDARTSAAELERLLRDVHGRNDVEVINAGVPGYTSWESLLALQLRIFELEPDLVVYYDNTNDVRPRLVPPERYRRDNSGWRTAWDARSPVWDHSLVLRWLGVQAGFSPRNDLAERTTLSPPADLDPEVALAANPPAYLADNLVDMVALTRHRHIDLLFASFAWSPHKNDEAATVMWQRALAENNSAILRVARENEVAWYDFAAEMPRDAELWADGVHVNELGAHKKAELFAHFVAGHFLAR